MRRPTLPQRLAGEEPDRVARVARQEGVATAAHDAIIARAIRIMEGRLQYKDVALTSPACTTAPSG